MIEKSCKVFPSKDKWTGNSDSYFHSVGIRERKVEKGMEKTLEE